MKRMMLAMALLVGCCSAAEARCWTPLKARCWRPRPVAARIIRPFRVVRKVAPAHHWVAPRRILWRCRT
jgi:hypothetical protein